ncbi:HesA/MoeB/ThiF family protein [Paractinoplanes lichenicola]|uniref:ThiF family adenylyltransferase n=1 Tax=Paractinoplanes lichenicola TaxID=2802976 RepID=A0ABS1VUA6_9ACTN|nr:ThiF family adenylyltransferase [Actinoplanes lichenicola]MBL7258013.1 ThiF family adenylyltransferase [Actinoplanes lichenicola]
MTATGLHSRSQLAGYDPEVLQRTRVAVIGLGALGQNVVQNLALSGVGHLLLVDYDEFEGHNATRSPFFPAPAEVERLGTGKAPVVADRAATIATAAEPVVRYAEMLVQSAGDAVIRWADVVVSAVDSVSARAWLAERCRIHGRPMIEGGFAAAEYNLSVFAGVTGAVCYRCLNPGRVSIGSCRAYARAAEAASIIPAIQTSAATLGALMAEQVIQVALGDREWTGLRAYGNVRRPVLSTAVLPVDPECPGQHAVLPVLGELPELPERLAGLVTRLRDKLGTGWLMLSEPAVVSMACVRCTEMCRVGATESVWLAAPRCSGCGGPWPRSTGETTPQAVRLLAVEDEVTGPAGEIASADLGIRAGCAVVVQDGEGRHGLMLMPGTPDSGWRTATPTGNVKTAIPAVS